VTQLRTTRLLLRPLRPSDFAAYREVRRRNAAWLARWEPRPPAGAASPSEDPSAFSSRCSARDRERQLGTGYAFALFHREQFCGELNLNNVVRGAFRSGHVGYWIDERFAGQGFIPEGLVAVLGFAFEQVDLHRVEINIIPRNASSLRVVEKLGLRQEGLAERLIEIDGVWEDHIRFAITAEEWTQRSAALRRLTEGFGDRAGLSGTPVPGDGGGLSGSPVAGAEGVSSGPPR
jgi:[ribosomal protein S5]-alanine N-acetyltransferase